MTTPSATFLTPQPQTTTPAIERNGFFFGKAWRDYFTRLDALLRNAQFGPLVNAANDTAAATAGVPINGFYRNGNAVQIRLT